MEVLVECGALTWKQGVIVGWKNEIDSRILCENWNVRKHEQHKSKQNSARYCHFQVTASVVRSCATLFSLIRCRPRLARKVRRFFHRKHTCRFGVRRLVGHYSTR